MAQECCLKEESIIMELTEEQEQHNRIGKLEGSFKIIMALMGVLISLSIYSMIALNSFVKEYNLTQIRSVGEYMMLSAKQQSLREKCLDAIDRLVQHEQSSDRKFLEVESSMDNFRDRIGKLEK